MTEKEYLCKILICLESLLHEIKENCPGCYDVHKLTCKLCDYSTQCMIECASDEDIQD